MKCRYCDKETVMPCRSTRDMEERSADPICDAALLRVGGGEYIHNQERARARVG